MPRFNTNNLSNKDSGFNRTSPIMWEGSKENDSVPQFGAEMRKQFLLGNDEKSKNVAFVNHGSYGATPKHVMKKRIDLLHEIEANPDLWYRSEMLKREIASTENLAKFVGATSSKDLIYVENVTEAMNIILKSLNLRSDDMVLCTSHTYRAVRYAIDDSISRHNADVLCLDIPKHIQSEEQIVQMFEEAALRYKGSIQLAVVDHITSPSATLLPVKKIASKLRPLGVLVLVDGAHAPGQVENIDLANMNVDFYTGNLHKWAYSCKGTAFMWVNPLHQGYIHPLNTSHTYKMPFPDEFYSRGTNDSQTKYIAASNALHFYDRIGGHKAIMNYVSPLLDWAVDMLCEAFNSKPLDIPDSMRAPCMRVIGCPTWLSHLDTIEIADDFVQKMSEEENVNCPVTVFNGKAWIRISANIYNTKTDYIKLRDVILKYQNN